MAQPLPTVVRTWSLTLLATLLAPSALAQEPPAAGQPPPAETQEAETQEAETQEAETADAPAEDGADGDGLPSLDDLPPELRQKLTSKDIVSILRTREEAKVEIAKKGQGEPMVSIVVPVAFFLLVFFIVGGALYYRYRKALVLHDTLKKMIENGVEIRPELLTTTPLPQSDLRRGVVLLSGGASVSLFLLFLDGIDDGVWAAGFIPAFIGAGYLLVWWLNKRGDLAS